MGYDSACTVVEAAWQTHKILDNQILDFFGIFYVISNELWFNQQNLHEINLALLLFYKNCKIPFRLAHWSQGDILQIPSWF